MKYYFDFRPNYTDVLIHILGRYWESSAAMLLVAYCIAAMVSIQNVYLKST